MALSQLELVSAMMGCAANIDPSLIAHSNSGKHAPINGHVCGWDNGKGRKKQPRNAQCLCGSGRKAKHCCVYV